MKDLKIIPVGIGLKLSETAKYKSLTLWTLLATLAPNYLLI